MGLMMLVLLIFGAWALSNQGKESAIISRAWQSFSRDNKKHIQKAYNCCGAYYWGSATEVADCPCNSSQCGGCIPLMGPSAANRPIVRRIRWIPSACSLSSFLSPLLSPF